MMLAGSVEVSHERTPGWQVKWAAIQHGLALLRNDYADTKDQRDSRDIEATVRALMVDLWSLRDWLNNDPSTAGKFDPADIDGFADRNPEFGHVRAFANSWKHHTIADEHRESAHLATFRVDAQGPSVSIRSFRAASPDAPGDLVDALRVAEVAELGWRQFLYTRQIDIPS